MRAGKMRHRITIQQRTLAQDTYGGASESWSTFATVWASKEDLQGSEFFNAQRVSAEVTVRFVIRYLAGLGSTMRVNDNGVTYDIEAVIDTDGRGRELQIMAKVVS